MISYPKIQTLWERQDEPGCPRLVIPGQYRLPHFGVVNQWIISEKVDGMNIRVGLEWGDDGWQLQVAGRSDKTQFGGQKGLLDYIVATLPVQKLVNQFWDETAQVATSPGIITLGGPLNFVLFGEGYGPKIQSGGIYADHQRFVLFDVWCGGYWLRWADVLDIAEALKLDVVPNVILNGVPDPLNLSELETLIAHIDAEGGGTLTSVEQVEGIVARSRPLMLSRRGDRVMWKLKRGDFK